MSGRCRTKSGRLAKQKVIDHRKKSLKAMALAKQKKRETEREQRDSYASEGFRLVNLKELGKNLHCIQCKEILSLANVTEETREGLLSILKVDCLKCGINNAVCTGKKLKINDKTYSDVNLSAVLGTIYSGMGCTELNKLLCCLDIPCISMDFYKRYESAVGSAIEAAAKESCKRAAQEERRLVVEHLERLCDTL